MKHCFFMISLIMLIFACVVVEQAQSLEAANIHVNSGKYEDYYHIEFTLTPENTLLTLKGYDRYGPSKYEFTAEGQFEVFIPKDKFPISAPNCKGYVILRMPGTLTDNPLKETLIAEKKILFDAIKEMKESCKGSVDVVIELNPYFRLIKKDPLELELEGANVFFRDAHGKYISHAGPIKGDI